MSKFKIGDRVRSNAPSKRYSITFNGWEGVVVNLRQELYSSNDIVVSSPDGTESYSVDSQYFDLITEYTIDYLKKNRLAVFLDNEEQHKALLKAGIDMVCWCYPSYYTFQGTWWSGGKKGKFESLPNTHGYTEIEYSQIKFENMAQKLVGYELVKPIPGDNRKVGDSVNTTVPIDYYEMLKDYWKPIYKNVEDEIKIGGYKAEFLPGEVAFGCQHFTRSQVEAFARFVEAGGYIEIDGGDISLSVLKKIFSRIK